MRPKTLCDFSATNAPSDQTVLQIFSYDPTILDYMLQSAGICLSYWIQTYTTRLKIWSG